MPVPVRIRNMFLLAASKKEDADEDLADKPPVNGERQASPLSKKRKKGDECK